jgi:O-acetyl-ADP-ribose deacetylase (regulator of RNase III)/molybdopterin converting factor small subunit
MTRHRMSITVRLPGPLRELAKGRSEIDIDADARTVADAFAALRARFPAVYDSIITESGELRPHVNVFVGMDNIRTGAGLATRLDGPTEITILPAVSGGRETGSANPTPAGARITLVRGDITQQQVDAIVNAANSSLLGGGGVDGAIHARGGPAILEACRQIRQTQYPGGLPAGQAVTTTAGHLPARRVIHTVGPIWHGGRHGEADILARAYTNSLERAREEGLRTVAFPSISTGAYGYPVAEAAATALAAVREYLAVHPAAFDEVRFVLFSLSDYNVYGSALDRSN